LKRSNDDEVDYEEYIKFCETLKKPMKIRKVKRYENPDETFVVEHFEILKGLFSEDEFCCLLNDYNKRKLIYI
jgi:hypothetical protein